MNDQSLKTVYTKIFHIGKGEEKILNKKKYLFNILEIKIIFN